ncbi:MAG: hypothetical protein Q4G27_05400 [Flavobacteriaceae bacterium]|nr:hypothetical protein [Flavobacteriaceae bacterium]
MKANKFTSNPIFYLLLVIFFAITSCSTNKLPETLLGKWELVEYGELINNEEHTADSTHENCPNDKYIFLSNNVQIIQTYQWINKECNKEVLERSYSYIDSRITADNEKFIYEVKELQSNLLKLHLIKHAFSDTESDNNRTVYIYKFIKN